MTDQLNLRGKSVAIVGPAESIGDQSAQVEACDFVIRCNHRWNGHDELTGYGSRVDAAFYSVAGSRAVKSNEPLLGSIPYIILKQGAENVNHPRVSRAPEPFKMANQVPIILNWLQDFHPSEVHIFGADFYTSGYEGSTQEAYLPGYDSHQYWLDINKHDQRLQHEWMRAFQDRTSLIKGDSRLLKLLSLSTDEFMARLNDAWREVHNNE